MTHPKNTMRLTVGRVNLIGRRTEPSDVPYEFRQKEAHRRMHVMAQLGKHSPAMERIDFTAFADLLAGGHGPGCSCPGCRRWVSHKLAELVRIGLGDRQVH